MHIGFRKPSQISGMALGDQRGITGLETAIVLIAFVVVAAVFAFGVISTGLFSSEKATATASAGLDEATTSLAPKGAVIAGADVGKTAIATVKYKVTNAAGADAVNLTPGSTLLTYSDPNNLETLVRSATLTGLGETAPWWYSDWKLGTGDAVDSGEVVEITVGLFAANATGDYPGPTLLGTGLGVNTSFKIEVIPAQGAPFTVSRTSPIEIKAIMDLQ